MGVGIGDSLGVLGLLEEPLEDASVVRLGAILGVVLIDEAHLLTIGSACFVESKESGRLSFVTGGEVFSGRLVRDYGCLLLNLFAGFGDVLVHAAEIFFEGLRVGGERAATARDEIC